MQTICVDPLLFEAASERISARSIIIADAKPKNIESLYGLGKVNLIVVKLDNLFLDLPSSEGWIGGD